MQGYGRTLITTAGSKMLTAVDGAKGKITYTKAVLYSQDIKGMSEDEQRALTVMSGEQMSTLTNVTDINDKTVTVSASFNNAKVTKDITFNSIGWFAKTTVDDQERLLAVTPSDTEQTLVAGSNGASTSALDINLAFARSDNATVEISPTEAGLISQAQLDAAINQVKINLEAEFPNVVNTAVSQVNNNIESLTALNSDSGNNIYNTKINLDTFSTIGISKFLGCQLQSDGKMADFDSTQGNLYGWIFVVPKWNGAQTYEQIVYISDFGQGGLTYVRTKADATSKEDFLKVANDKDLAKIHTISNPIEVDNKTNPDSLTEPGIYFSKNGFNFSKNDIPNGYRSDGKTYIFVLEGENPGYSLNYYQQLMFQATKFNFECWYRAGYKYDSDAYYTVSFVNLKDIFGKLKQISLNDDTPISPNDEGIANLKVVTSVQNIAPDNQGNVKLIKPATNSNLDKIVQDGIYDIQGTYNGQYINGLLIVRNFTVRTFQLLISYDMDPMMQYRYINVDVGLYRNWEKLLNQDDYKNLTNRIAILENKEIVHQCDDLDSGIAYSKAHPNVFVATP
ncbi:hypothetical protein [Lactobacillus sp. wkB10]|uniref:hypothetical protein n=1 Tax=Lactobacillus sp. wkB10 TaxID=1545701 RepID=UPI000512BAF5|nr:hypothetical protein [Lactobacillus sp. wkB10]KGG53981.1 hypothetical protein LACWKB10_1201 [Lactobacillus sp. wkB10]